MGSGHCFAQMRLQVYLIVGVRNLKNCTLDMKERARQKKVVQAQALWFEILKSQIETGTPYMLFKERMRAAQVKFIASLNSMKSSELDSSKSEQDVSICDGNQVLEEPAPVVYSLCRDPDSKSPASYLILLQSWKQEILAGKFC